MLLVVGCETDEGSKDSGTANHERRVSGMSEHDMPGDDMPGDDMPGDAGNVVPGPCERRDPRVSVTADRDGSVLAGTPVTYRLSITNESDPSCAPEMFLTSVTPPLEGPGFRVEPDHLTTQPLAAGESSEQEVVVTSGSTEEAATYRLDFFVRSQLATARSSDAVLASEVESTYVVAEPDGCHVAPSRELLIRHTSVVDDPVRSLAPDGAWTFGHLMEQLAPDAAAAPDLAEAMFRTFTARQTINGFNIAGRPAMEPSVLKPWPRAHNGKLDLARSPLLLLAIAHRLDLADLPNGRAGEGRFVFGVLRAAGGSLLVTLILEYVLPAKTEAELRDWAFAVHALQDAPFPSDEYNRALQALTERYTARGVMPDLPNGSALLRVRTNDGSLGPDGRWEMREFHLSRTTGLLEPAPLAQTPDRSFNGDSRLARFIDENEASILTEKHETPPLLGDAPFQAGALMNDLEHWDAAGIKNPEARYKFSLNTCDGCHGGETATSFFHILPRNKGSQSQLSTFLTGSTIRDAATGEPRTYNELARRQRLLENIVCEPDHTPVR
jgi:hypothetical protein